jgi:hypothetical protein
LLELLVLSVAEPLLWSCVAELPDFSLDEPY